MTKKTYLIITIVAGLVALIGLISLVGGIRPVNLGAFVFPLIVAVWGLYKFIK